MLCICEFSRPHADMPGAVNILSGEEWTERCVKSRHVMQVGKTIQEKTNLNFGFLKNSNLSAGFLPSQEFLHFLALNRPGVSLQALLCAEDSSTA